MNHTSMEEKRTSFECLLDQNGLGNRDAVVCYKEPSEKDLYKVEPQELEKQFKKRTNKEYEPCEGSQCEEGKPCEQEDLQQKDPTEEQYEEPTEDELSEGSIAWLSSESDNEDQHCSVSAQSISEEKKRRLLKILSFANHLCMRKQWSPLDQSSPYKCDSEDGTAVAWTATTPFVNSTSMREQSTFVCQLDEDGSGSEGSEKEQLYKREPMEEQQCVTQPKKEERPPKGSPDEEGKPCEVIRKEEATEEHNEELTGDVLSKGCIAWFSPETNCELNCLFNSSVSSSEKKRRSPSMSDSHAKKRLKQDTGEISLKDTQKSGSSGKRRLDKQGGDPEADGCNMAKKRRTGWTIDDTQLKILGPLKLPDLVKGVVSATEPDPHAVKLNSQLLEINRKLMSQEAIDDLAEDELSPSPPPVYNDLGIRINTRDARLRRKLSDRRQKIVSDLIRTDPIFKSSPEYKPQKLFKKLYIPVEQYPGYNFIGLIIGPRGRTQKAMEKETGARIILRGKGSCRFERAQHHKDAKTEFLEDDDLHVHLEADSQESLDAAVKIIENLLVPVEEGRNKHKHAQLRELAELTSRHREETSSKIQRTVNKPNASCTVSDDARIIRSPLPTVSTPEGCSHGGLFSSGGPVVPKPTLPCMGNALDGSSSCSGKAEEIDKAKLFVCLLPKSMNDDGLRRLFVPFGPLCEAVVVKDKITGSSKGYGFVKYTSPRFAAEAVARMNGYRIDGKVLVVRVASRSRPTANVARNSRGLPGIGHLQTYSDSAATTPVNPSMTSAIMSNENISPLAWHPSGPLPPEPYASFPPRAMAFYCKLFSM